MSERTYKLMD